MTAPNNPTPEVEPKGDGDMRLLGVRDGYIHALINVRDHIGRIDGPYSPNIHPTHTKKQKHRDEVLRPLKELERRLVDDLFKIVQAYNKTCECSNSLQRQGEITDAVVTEHAATISRLTAERDKWRDAWMKCAFDEAEAIRERDEAIERTCAAEKRVKELEEETEQLALHIARIDGAHSERVAVLENALEPFARAMEFWDSHFPEASDDALCDAGDCTVGDLRRALAAREAK